jgi:hypothetical protein
MVLNFRTILISLVIAMACRRESPPPAVAPAAPSPAPIATGAPDATQSAAEAPAASGETPDKKAQEVGSAAAAAPEDQTARRKAAVRAASDQQRPLTKEMVRRLNTEKNAGAPSRAVAASEKVAATPASPASPSTTAASPASPAATARATLRFRNDAGATYKLVEARFVMDGAELPTVITGAVRGQSQWVFSGEVTPGRHVIASRITYQGADRAVFTYMKGYTFRVQSDDTFVARADKAVAMTIVCKEKTGFNDPVEKRLFVTVE